jgi:polyferredoxin
MKRLKWQGLRSLIQVGFVVYLAWLAFGGLFTGIRGEGTHSICPVGALETMPTLFASLGNRYVREASFNNFIMLGSLLLATLAFGGAFCGWACPVGSLGEWLYKLRKLIFKKDLTVSPKTHALLGWLRYVVLGLLFAMSFATASLWFEHLDPFIGIFSIRLVFGASIAVVGLFVVGSFVYERFFCSFMCPLGAVIKPFARIGATGIVRDPSLCNGCKNCTSVCSKKIPVDTQIKINRGECILCMRCIEECSSGNALSMKIGW